MTSSIALLDKILHRIDHPYRLPAIPVDASKAQETDPATELAIVIEQARAAAAGEVAPDAALKRRFIQALARMICDAMHPESGDPAFQAIVLRHRSIQVREYASLQAHADQDRRKVRTVVNAIAHPAKQQRIPPGRPRESLAQLHRLADAASWSAVAATAQGASTMIELANEPSIRNGLTQLLDSSALKRLTRLQHLTSDALVRRYQSLWHRHGPRSGSPSAIAQGIASQQRGAAVEASAEEALNVLAHRLNQMEETPTRYRVVTSMRVPASIPASAEFAKGEWDAVLLRKADTTDDPASWDVALLVEAKASVDAATKDLPRLLRGLALLGHADENLVYSFETRQGSVPLRGASLRALAGAETNLAGTVLYCCDAPVEAATHLLGAAGRMQLLSAPASMDFAAALADEHPADALTLEAVWHQLTKSPRWKTVLHQYLIMRQARSLMVRATDLLDAITSVAG